MQGGRLEGFEEALGEPDGEAIPDPAPLDPSAPHFEVPDFGVLTLAEVRPELGRRIVGIDIAA